VGGGEQADSSSPEHSVALVCGPRCDRDRLRLVRPGAGGTQPQGAGAL